MPACRLAVVYACRAAASGVGNPYRERVQLTGIVDTAASLLANPLVAVCLGAALGVVLLLASRSSFGLMHSDDPARGMLFTAMLLPVRLGFALFALWAYKRIAPQGIVPFALSFAGGFVVLYTVELVRYAGLSRYARPAIGHRDGR